MASRSNRLDPRRGRPVRADVNRNGGRNVGRNAATLAQSGSVRPVAWGWASRARGARAAGVHAEVHSGPSRRASDTREPPAILAAHPAVRPAHPLRNGLLGFAIRLTAASKSA